MSKKRLDVLVFEKGLVSSREKATRLILAGRIFVDGRMSSKSGMKFDENVEIMISKGQSFVSRGGDKIKNIHKDFFINFKNKVVADIGASTGGFTDYALKSGAKRVMAVDVGYGQLDQKLRENEKVTNLEKTDIRKIEKFEEIVDIFLIDVSFVSLKKIMPMIKKIVDIQGNKVDIIALVKPQFEVGKSIADKCKGIIKDKEIIRNVLTDIESFCKREKFVVLAQKKADIKGMKGNQEYLFYMRYPQDSAVFGTFDILHEGHLSFLEKTGNKKCLHVIVPSDKRVKELKGKEPKYSFKKRKSKLEEKGFSVEEESGDPWANVLKNRIDSIYLGYDQDWENLIRNKMKETKYLVNIEKVESSLSKDKYKSSIIRDNA